MTLALAVWAGLTRVSAPALRVMLRRRVLSGREIAARLPEREAIEHAPRPDGRLIWLHAASLGETVSILAVLAELARAPGTILLTTGTVTSQRLLAQRLPDLGLDERVIHRFVPLDVPAWGARFLDHWRPDAAAFVESEIWPNLLGAAARRGIPLMLVNARLSARSLARWQMAPRTARMILGWFTVIHPQSTLDGDRFALLGAARVLPAGNLKLAAPPLPADHQALSHLSSLIGGPAWVAASLHRGEDELVLAAHRRLSAIRGCSPSSCRATRIAARRLPPWPAMRPGVHAASRPHAAAVCGSWIPSANSGSSIGWRRWPSSAAASCGMAARIRPSLSGLAAPSRWERTRPISRIW
jgi:3-deoxy-D-manno-octulosonic-acid transferase